MFLPSMTLPPDALLGPPAHVARFGFGDVLAVGPWALLPIGLALALTVLMLVVRAASRRHERRQIRPRTSAAVARDESFSRAA